MSLRTRTCVAAAATALFISPGHAADDRARVSALADRFVAAYQENFPVSYAFTGLAPQRNDGIDSNAPAENARWHSPLAGKSADHSSLKAEGFAGHAELEHRHFRNLAA